MFRENKIRKFYDIKNDGDYEDFLKSVYLSITDEKFSTLSERTQTSKIKKLELTKKIKKLSEKFASDSIDIEKFWRKHASFIISDKKTIMKVSNFIVFTFIDWLISTITLYICVNVFKHSFSYVNKKFYFFVGAEKAAKFLNTTTDNLFERYMKEVD